MTSQTLEKPSATQIHKGVVPICRDERAQVQHPQMERTLRMLVKRSDDRTFMRQLHEDGMLTFRRAWVLDHIVDATLPTWQCPDCPRQIDFDPFVFDEQGEFEDLKKIARHMDGHRNLEKHLDDCAAARLAEMGDEVA